MKKIISLFKRDYEKTGLVYNEFTPGSEWVQNGEGVATVKLDGTACLVRDGKLYKRYDAKKRIPPNFEPAQDRDPITGHYPGWLPVGEGPEDQWHREAFVGDFENGATYELIGPKVQSNPYFLASHHLIRHGALLFLGDKPPRTFNELKLFLSMHLCEGIVWHRENGDMVKIKRSDFGFNWPVSRSEYHSWFKGRRSIFI